MRWRRAAAFVLALILALTTAGCGGRTFFEALDEITGGGKKPGGAGGRIWRADVDYSDMEYECYEIADLGKYTDALKALARDGGSGKAFLDAESALYEELCKIYTMYTLASNASYADTANGELAAEADLALDTFYKAYNEFMLAHRELAVSEHSDLLKESYDDMYISWFKLYESAEQEDELSREENGLISRYYSLASDTEANAEEIRDIFVRLVELRRTAAKLRGYGSYAEMAYGSTFGKNYSPEDAKAVWEGAKEYFAPLMWDASGRILGACAALEEDTHFDCSEKTVLKALGDCAGELSPELVSAYKYLTDYHLYDLGTSSKKAQVGFTVLLHYYNEPFIFNASSGTFYDYADLMHEFGHFASYYFSPSELIFGVADNDLSELQSQGMSVVMSFLFEDEFGKTRGEIMRECVLMELAMSVVDGAMYDEFQQRVFAEEDLTPERVDEIFAQVYKDYGYAPYEGYEREWMTVAHNFETPFYYISYAVSALGALEINELCEEDFDAGLQKYMELLKTDPETVYYTEALEKTGLSDIFDISAYESIAGALARSLDVDRTAAA